MKVGNSRGIRRKRGKQKRNIEEDGKFKKNTEGETNN